jgi:uncharacterized spore protein YtfJ
VEVDAMDVESVISGARDALTVQRVFGEPYERNGVTIIPAAVVRGGAGGGSGDSPQGTGGGTGFGLSARPVGAFVLRDGDWEWKPAVDVTRLILGAQIVFAVAWLAIRSIGKARAKARAKAAVAATPR